MGLRELKKELAHLEKEELIHHLEEIYRRFPKAKAYLDFFVEADEEALLDKYKAIIYESYFSMRKKGPKHYAARRALNEFKKLAVNQEAIADLHFYYAHMALLYVQESGTKKLGDSERVVTAYRQVIEFLAKLDLLQEFKGKAQELAERREGLVYPLDQEIESIYRYFFPEES